ncbi:MAG: NERD domain-containing protein [Methanomicrobiales archaeon]|nr:NERD domain-containing protein [Methanomicrobiales archaeon]
MAEFIPDRLPSSASRGEERTFAFLKKLPDDYLVYYEPNIDNRHPDFIVIAPDLGVIIIEVKGWYLDDIVKGNHSEITINTQNRERQESHPLEQARNYMWRLAGACEKSPNRSKLFHQEGHHKNKFFFPFCHFVVLSNISRDNILRRKDQNVSEIFKTDNTLFRDELVALENASSNEIRNILMRFFDPFWEITPFTPEQVDVLRSIIHPEIILSYLPSKSLTENEAEKCFDLVVLDRRQENNARKIGEGHRIIYGVAGSGKTVLLIARAKWLHERDPHTKILMLCYNVVLSVYLKHVLKNYPRIDVFHFDGWVKHNGIPPRIVDPSTRKFEEDANLGSRLLEHLRNHTGDSRKYDAILVDEAQDFPPIWFSCILEALTDPFDGDLLIVCDGNQGIRLIDSVSWKSLGIKAVGRTIHQAFDLDRNYRNTREILKLAAHFTAKNVKNNEDSISIVPVDPSQAIRRGPKPMLIKCQDHADECERIFNIAKVLLNGSVPFNEIKITLQPQDMGILYFKKLHKDREIFKDFLKDLGTRAPVTWLNEDRYSRMKVFEQSIKVQTVASSKGLQYRVVFVMWTDLFEPHTRADLELQQRFLYVALTRASDVLIITYSETNDFIERMVASGDAMGK